MNSLEINVSINVSKEDKRRGLPPTFRWWRKDRHRLAYALMLPAICLVLIVTIYPAIYVGWLSLFRTDFMRVKEFVGLENYGKLLADPEVRASALTSTLYTFGTLALEIPLATGLAIALSHDLPLRGVLRALFILPWVVARVVAALLWMWLLNAQFGLFNFLLKIFLGGQALNFLSDSRFALPSVIVASVWRSYPFAMILILAALQMIPDELYEAARIDGASAWRRFRFITLPMIRNTLLVIVLLTSLSYFNTIEFPMVMTNGGPGNATNVLSLRMYKEAFTLYRLSNAATLSVMILAINAVLSLLYIRVLRTESYY